MLEQLRDAVVIEQVERKKMEEKMEDERVKMEDERVKMEEKMEKMEGKMEDERVKMKEKLRELEDERIKMEDVMEDKRVKFEEKLEAERSERQNQIATKRNDRLEQLDDVAERTENSEGWVTTKVCPLGDVTRYSN